MNRLWEILVPTVFNDGTKISTLHHKIWDAEVQHISGGLTILTPAKGQWIHSNQLFQENMIPVRIACTEAEINQIADFTAKHYQQKAVMFYLLSELVRIKYYA